jgi:hypothetical protein
MMDEFDLCRIADTFTLTTAAALIIGIEPSRVRPQDQFGNEGYCIWYSGDQDPDVAAKKDNAPHLFRTALDTLVRAVQAETLAASVVYLGERRYIREPDGSTSDMRWLPAGDFVTGRTTVSLDNLRTWLASRGVTSGFFFPQGTNEPDYLNPSAPHYAPKLAAAVRAWQLAPVIHGKSPKECLGKWLREHAAEFGLTKDDGKINETAVNEIAKICNWSAEGGAPKS